MAIQYLNGINVSGDVGIGTDTPYKTLDVQGEAVISQNLWIGPVGGNDAVNSLEIGRGRTGNGICFIDMTTDNTTYTDYGFRLIRFSGVNANTELIHRGTGDFRIKGQEASNMRFYTGNSARMSITSSGDVGIGTTSPAAKLVVNGAIVSKGGNYSVTNESVTNAAIVVPQNDKIYCQTSGGYLRNLIHMDSSNNIKIGQTSTSLVNDMYLSTGNSGIIRFETTGSESMRINSAGNVGIGTTSPVGKLSVYRTDNTYAVNLSDARSRSSLYLKSAGNYDSELTFSSGQSNVQLIQAVNSAATTGRNIAINPFGGNVGIGTISPSEKLVVRGGGYASNQNGGIAVQMGDEASSHWKSAVKIKSNSSGVPRTVIETTTGQTSGQTNDAIEINTSGQVGIGTTSPQYQLHSYNEIGTQTLRLGYGAGYARITTDDASKPIDFQIGGSTKMSLNQYGNVGIGITSPHAKLHVEGDGVAIANGANTKTTLIPSGGGNSELTFKGQNYQHYVNYETSWNSFRYARLQSSYNTSDAQFFLYKSNGTGGTAATTKISTGNSSFAGNVGIGTTSPNTALEVDGAISTTTSDYVQGSTGSRLLLETSGSGNTHSYIQAQSSGGTSNAEDLALQLYGGNVGIGTASPSTALDVVGSATATNFYVGSSGTMQLFDYSGNLHIYSTSGTDIFLGGGIGDRQNDVTIGNGNLTVDGDINAVGTGSFGNGSAYALKLKSSTGARGIEISDSNGVDRGGIDWSASDFVIRNSSDSNLFKLNYSTKQADFYGNLNAVGNISADNFVSVQGVDPGNPSATSEELRLSGYGILGNRSAMYITNGHSTGTLRFGIGGSGVGGGVKMLLNSAGELGIGTTSPAQKLHVDGTIAANSGGFEIRTGSYGNLGLKSFYGSLYTTTSVYVGGVNGIPYASISASAFNVNSDYRLKSNLVTLENAVSRVKKLPVHRFNWKDRENENKVDGFLAHEVSDVVPEAVTGEKDAVREDGTFEYQQVDQSKIVPLLTAALKEAIEKIEQLENRIQTLENN
jgi:hypothetical protein